MLLQRSCCFSHEVLCSRITSKSDNDEWSKVRIKDEPEDDHGEDGYYRGQDLDDYGGDAGFNAQIKTEQDEDHKPFNANGATTGH